MLLETVKYFSLVRNFNYEMFFQLDTRELLYAVRNY